MKQQPGKDIYAVGGATLISSLMNMELIDEIRLVMHPVVLGGGKALFKDVDGRHALELIDVGRIASGPVRLIYARKEKLEPWARINFGPTVHRIVRTRTVRRGLSCS